MVAFGFLPQNFGRWQGPTQLSFCLKRNAASVVLTMLGGGNTQTLLDGKKNLWPCRWWGCKHFLIFPSFQVQVLVLSMALVALALAPHMSHLDFHYLILLLLSLYLNIEKDATGFSQNVCKSWYHLQRKLKKCSCSDRKQCFANKCCWWRNRLVLNTLDIAEHSKVDMSIHCVSQMCILIDLFCFILTV